MTTERLQHDPRTKKQIKDCLYAYLYTPVDTKMRKELDGIINANRRAAGSSQDGFSYRNEWFSLNPDVPPPRSKTRLLPDFRPVMDDYLAKRTQINELEIPYVLGFINAVLNSSDDMEDYLLVFPSLLHPPLKKLISTCPCRGAHLKPETITEMRERNQVSIELIKTRLVTNLLLQ